MGVTDTMKGRPGETKDINISRTTIHDSRASDAVDPFSPGLIMLEERMQGVWHI